jgi:hypothetical protein
MIQTVLLHLWSVIIVTELLLLFFTMAALYAYILDINGAFLYRRFSPLHQFFMRVPLGFEKHYPPKTILLLNKTLYGTMQAT